MGQDGNRATSAPAGHREPQPLRDESTVRPRRLAWADLSLALALGELHAEFGEPEGARVLLRELAGAAHEDGMRERAQELLDRLDARGR